MENLTREARIWKYLFRLLTRGNRYIDTVSYPCMYTTEEFRTQVYSYYEENGITVGDPSFGKWNHCHIVPACEGGTETILMLREHHIMHDLIQSKEYDRRCFYTGDAYAWLYGEGFLCEHWFELVELAHHYAAIDWKGRWANTTPEERSEYNRAMVSRRWAAMTPEERSEYNRQRMRQIPPEERAASAVKRWDTRRRRKALRSLGADLYGAMWSDGAEKVGGTGRS